MQRVFNFLVLLQDHGRREVTPWRTHNEPSFHRYGKVASPLTNETIARDKGKYNVDLPLLITPVLTCRVAGHVKHLMMRLCAEAG